MENLNVVNLIQAGTITVGILGGLLLWLTKTKEFRGIAILLFCIALSASINILEESGVTRDIYLISPIFIMLFGPLNYLAARLLINKQLAKHHLWHLLPIIPFLLLTSYIQAIIGLGTVWRLVYAFLTIVMLLNYKRSLDEERSDSDEYSLNWLVWFLVITSLFNLVDLVRLNIQPTLPYALNILGQGVNNSVWLVAVMFIIIKMQLVRKIPVKMASTNTDNAMTTDVAYHSIFKELDELITENQWFRKPRLTLNDVSDLTGIQVRDISRAINLVTKKSFNDYINNYRVNFVCKLLEKSDNQSLSDIAAEAGFSSKASFNKVFKLATKVTPSKYKAKYQV